MKRAVVTGTLSAVAAALISAPVLAATQGGSVVSPREYQLEVVSEDRTSAAEAIRVPIEEAYADEQARQYIDRETVEQTVYDSENDYPGYSSEAARYH